VEALAAAPDGRRLYLTREFEGELLAWDLGDDLGPEPLEWSRRFRDVSSLALSPDGRTLALGGRDGSIRLVDTSRGAVAGTLPPEVEGDGPIMSLAFDPDGGTLAVGLPHGRIALWSVAAPRRPSPIVHLPGHDSGVTSLAFDGDGRRLASSDDKVVQVWDLGRVRTRLEDLGLGW
jgi:WD40 repeat protein